MVVSGTSMVAELRGTGKHTFIWPIFLECLPGPLLGARWALHTVGGQGTCWLLAETG